METWICIDPISALRDAAGNQLLAGLSTTFEPHVLTSVSHLLLQSSSCLLKALAEVVSKCTTLALLSSTQAAWRAIKLGKICLQ